MQLKMTKVTMLRAGNEATEVAVASSVRLAVAFPPKNLHIHVTPQHPKVSKKNIHDHKQSDCFGHHDDGEMAVY